MGRAPFCYLASEKSEKCQFLGAQCVEFFKIVSNEFSQVSREDLFPAESLGKKRHLLEHDKHLATAL